MHILDLKTQVQAMLEDFVKIVPEKQYFGVNICDRANLGYFSKLHKDIKDCTGWVYVIFNEDKQQCKIGHTCCDPVARAKNIFPFMGGKSLYVAAFPVVGTEPWNVERFVQNMLYAGSLQSRSKQLGVAQAHSGGTEIFDIRPAVACALVEQAIETVRFIK